MPTSDEFEAYFHKTAELADDLFGRGFRTEAFLATTVAIDALASIWRHDFGVEHESAALGFAAFVDTFARDPKSGLICVVFLAEDVLANGPTRLHDVARRLLKIRAALDDEKVNGWEFRECPHAHRDVVWADLVEEEPSLATEVGLKAVAREYTRAALAYRLYRCGPAHSFSRGSRTSGFADPRDDDEISYFPRYLAAGKVRPISLHIGLHTFTRWLRAAATNYAAECKKTGKRPATDFDASAESLAMLASRWKKLT